jgi:hypothetical protein
VEVREKQKQDNENRGREREKWEEGDRSQQWRGKYDQSTWHANVIVKPLTMYN